MSRTIHLTASLSCVLPEGVETVGQSDADVGALAADLSRRLLANAFRGCHAV